jgi:hypothetical protein
MNKFTQAMRRFFVWARRVLAVAWAASLKWLAVPLNLCLSVIGLVFVVSFLSWAIGDRFEESLLFFPDAKGVLRGEVREVPHSRGSEARAELIASEVLLGPQSAGLAPAFVPNVRVESVLLRKGRLFVDISPGAALAAMDATDPNAIKWGIAAMERSLRTSLPGIKRLTVTIGGKEPYTDRLKTEGGHITKKTGK